MFEYNILNIKTICEMCWNVKVFVLSYSTLEVCSHIMHVTEYVSVVTITVALPVVTVQVCFLTVQWRATAWSISALQIFLTVSGSPQGLPTSWYTRVLKSPKFYITSSQATEMYPGNIHWLVVIHIFSLSPPKSSCWAVIPSSYNLNSCWSGKFIMFFIISETFCWIQLPAKLHSVS